MKVIEAKDIVLELSERDCQSKSQDNPIDPSSPDPNDPGKFLIQGKVARAIHRFDGWHIPINLSWFDGSFEMPEIHQYKFYWYAFAIPKYAGFKQLHYYVCDYLQVREWVLDFKSPLGNDYRDQSSWRADFQPYKDDYSNNFAYFRWGDEAVKNQTKLSRVINLDNIVDIASKKISEPSHDYRPESEAHLRLKEYIAKNPDIIGLSSEFEPYIEYMFCTGDHVDVLFMGPEGKVAVVEIEIEGEDKLIVGAHQAIKYRSLALSERRYKLDSTNVMAFLVAFITDYPEVISISDQYDIGLVSIDKNDVFE